MQAVASRTTSDVDEREDFEAAFRQVSRSAFLLARHLGRDTEAATDVVQEAALRAWRYRSSRTGEFRPWFLTIVYRLCRGPMPGWLPLPRAWDRAAPDPIESSMDPELLAALRTLPPRQRAALWLRYCDDLTTADVARILHCSETAAKQLLLRARDSLRERLTEQESKK
ncbi:MAG TPA: sigma-70 family RNA polymerase sigma factor [Candidatus Dormibacteraeota bacterium]|jgi:RNA polymerase sigma-70 factor (ECF subfamily)|nr:sigma-70 family RNA polymerase sigma factor [Candidatus Dormibacteraeota bacterium]